MPVAAKCPTCRATHPDPAEPGERVTCEACGETYTVPRPAAAAAPPPPPDPASAFDFSAKKSRDDEDEDDEPVVTRPRSRPPERKPSAAARAIVGGVKWYVSIAVAAGVLGGLAGVYYLVTGKRPDRGGPPVAGPVPPKGEQPDPDADRPLAPFEEPKNPYRPGTQTRLKEVGTAKLPPLSVPRFGSNQLAYSPKHRLVFVLTPAWVLVVDAGTGEEVGRREPEAAFTGIGLSPDEAVLFAGDPDGKQVHRFSLADRAWAVLANPVPGRVVRAVDADRFLLLGGDRVVLCAAAGGAVRETGKNRGAYGGDVAYDPRTGRVFYAPWGLSATNLNFERVAGGRLAPDGPPMDLPGSGGATLVLSQDGTRLYRGPLQYDAAAVRSGVRVFPEPVVAASRDLAFGPTGYYRADTAAKVADYGFKTSAGASHDHLNGNKLPLVAVAPDGRSVWVSDADGNLLRHYALDGDE